MSKIKNMVFYFKKSTICIFLILCLFSLNVYADEVIGNTMDLHDPLETGGLILNKLENIEIISQELYISENKITVNYVFENKTNKDIKTIVSFPLPTVTSDPTGGDFVIKIDKTGAGANKSFIKFNIWVEEKQILLPAIKKTILYTNIRDGEDFIDVLYDWEQTFPKGKPIHIRLEYEPILGIDLAEAYYSTKIGDVNYDISCRDDIYLDVDKLVKKGGPFNAVELYNIGYVFSTQSNWAGGTIGDYRLVVDKGKSKNLVSFCGENIKKISPTQFEMRAKNYKPAKNLYITIINNHK